LINTQLSRPITNAIAVEAILVSEG